MPGRMPVGGGSGIRPVDVVGVDAAGRTEALLAGDDHSGDEVGRCQCLRRGRHRGCGRVGARRVHRCATGAAAADQADREGDEAADDCLLHLYNPKGRRSITKSFTGITPFAAKMTPRPRRAITRTPIVKAILWPVLKPLAAAAAARSGSAQSERPSRSGRSSHATRRVVLVGGSSVRPQQRWRLI